MSSENTDYASFTYCPDCGKKGVQFHFAKVISGEDGYGCRYCDFWFFTAGDRMNVDRENERRWSAANEENASRERHYVYGVGVHGTVHLIDFDQAAQYPNPAPLCGSRGRAALRHGDETLSGARTTCKRCRKLAELPAKHIDSSEEET